MRKQGLFFAQITEIDQIVIVLSPDIEVGMG